MTALNRASRLSPFFAHESIAGMGEAIDDLINVVSEAAVKIDPFDFERQRGLLKKLSIIGQ